MGKQHEETLSLIHIFLTAVLDRDADALILCRDRVGERRVFYTAADGCVAFADHPDMLLEAGCLRPVIDADGLRELFGLGPARTPGRTPWRDMRALEAGCALVARGNDVRAVSYTHLALSHLHGLLLPFRISLARNAQKTQHLVFETQMSHYILDYSILQQGSQRTER